MLPLNAYQQKGSGELERRGKKFKADGCWKRSTNEEHVKYKGKRKPLEQDQDISELGRKQEML